MINLVKDENADRETLTEIKNNSMDSITVRIINNSPYPAPEYATEGSAGCDLRANITENITVNPLQRVLVPTGIHIELPSSCEAQIRSRSGLTVKHGIVVANGIGTIDTDYRGEIKVALVNLSDEAYEIRPGEKIAQMVFSYYKQACFETCTSLDETKRADGGFGSTGNM